MNTKRSVITIGVTLLILAVFLRTQVIAWVNCKPIFRSTIDSQYQREFNFRLNNDEKLKQKKLLLKKEITRTLIEQEGRRKQIQVKDAEIDTLIQSRMKERNYSDLETFVSDYKTTVSNLRRETRVDLISQKILESEVEKKYAAWLNGLWKDSKITYWDLSLKQD